MLQSRLEVCVDKRVILDFFLFLSATHDHSQDLGRLWRNRTRLCVSRYPGADLGACNAAVERDAGSTGYGTRAAGLAPTYRRR